MPQVVKSSKPSVGIIGDGHVGSALQKGIERAGYQVQVTGNEPDRVRETAKRSDLIILAIPWAAYGDAIQTIGPGLDNKILVDVSNLTGKGMVWDGDEEKNGAVHTQQIAPRAKVVKGFNTIFAQHMAVGEAHGEKLTVFAASDHDDAKAKVLQLARDIGFEAVDAGPLEDSYWLEALGHFHIKLNSGRDAGFRMVGATTTKSEARTSGAARADNAR